MGPAMGRGLALSSRVVLVVGAGAVVGRSQSDVRLSDGARPPTVLLSVVWGWERGVNGGKHWWKTAGLAVHRRQEVKETRGKLLAHLSRWLNVPTSLLEFKKKTGFVGGRECASAEDREVQGASCERPVVPCSQQG